MLPYTDKMSFTERWYNIIAIFYDWFMRKFYYLPNERQYVKEHFGHLAPLPSMDEVMQNVSVILVNTHRALDPPRPLMPSKFHTIF